MVQRTLCGLACCALSLAACATPTPTWFERLLEREVDLAEPQPLASPDGYFHTRVAGLPDGPVVETDGVYQFAVGLGTEAPVQCWVHRTQLDLAASLAEFSRLTFEGIAETLGEVEARHVHSVETGAFRETPFIYVDWLYRVNQGGTRLAGHVKHLVASKGDSSVYCQHNETGYRESFRELVGGLVEELAFPHVPAAEPYYQEISTIAMRGQRVGVQRMTFTRDDDGDTRIARESWLLLPIDSETLRTSDSVDVEFSASDGALINQAHVEATNGELVTDLRLEPAAGGAWTVSGTFQSKAIDTTLRPDQPPDSSLAEVLALRRGLADPGPELSLSRWVPQADPTRLIDQKLVIGEPIDGKRTQARISLGGIDADLVLDEQGMAASGQMDMGFARIDFERVFASGEI